MQAVVSKGDNGKVRVDYQSEGTNNTVLFEPVGENTLESRFGSLGGITGQRLIKGNDTASIANDFVAGIGGEAVRGEYSDIVLEKACPKCGGGTLQRSIDTMFQMKEVPVMPLYTCSKCGARSYYLTDEYLRNLIAENSALFEDTELEEKRKDEGSFMSELRAYIIRIFASQRIMEIK